MTCCVVGALTYYAFVTKNDFTVLGSFLLVLCTSLLLTMVLCFVFHSRFLRILYCGLAIMLLGFYLIVDTQMLRGNSTVAFSEDDYIIAALLIYSKYRWTSLPAGEQMRDCG